jgi:hypothetical protein
VNGAIDLLHAFRSQSNDESIEPTGMDDLDSIEINDAQVGHAIDTRS